MKRNAPYILGIVVLLTLLVAGVGYAWSAKSSDVDDPTLTAADHIVKYHVIGSSMAPTYQAGDWLVVNTKFSHVSDGEVVVFHFPEDRSVLYCRRIVAVAGDTVVMRYFSNVKLTTIYVPNAVTGNRFPVGVVPNGNAYGQFKTAVTDGNVYVVGDNAAPGGSYDSDEWGQLPIRDIIGVVASKIVPRPHSS